LKIEPELAKVAMPRQSPCLCLGEALLVQVQCSCLLMVFV
jgi:hypothetical protein